jgi:glycosyl transferase family 1
LPSLKIIYDVDGWAYHNEALALQKYAPADFSVSLVSLPRREAAASALESAPVDLVFLLGESKVSAVRETMQQRRWRSKLVAGWSCGFPHRLGEFYAMRDAADAWIFNNQECWDRTGHLPHTFMIPNGVDLEVFTVTQPLDRRAPKVLWVGSERYQRLKGYEDFVLPLQEQLRALGIACELLLVDATSPHKRTPQQMAEWYNSGTVLVCASESEGTPNPALEAAACGCTVVSTRVGNMPKLIIDDVNGYLVDREIAALTAAVHMACENYHRLATNMQTDIQAWHWATRSGEFFRLFREILDGRDEPRAPRPDLSAALTVFVTTVGAPTFENCLAHLRDQDCAYTLQVIDRVAPMNVAFQRMLDECRTPYYVQVDEDMLLYPHAVRTLYETMRDAGSHVAIVAADLYDVHVKRRILGVKIFRHAIVRRYPLDAVDEFEKLQVERLEADGYIVARTAKGAPPVVGAVLGLHGTQWTPQSIYERYATLERRRRAFPHQMRWVREHHAEFLQRFLEEPSELNFFALLGMIAGVLASANGQTGAKDYRTYAALPGFEALRRFLTDFEQPVPEDGEDVS